MDVLLVDFPEATLIPQRGWCLGYRYMIALLRNKGYSADILYPVLDSNNNADKVRLLKNILHMNPKIVGFTTYDMQLKAIIDFACRLKKAGCRATIVLGGMCASFIPRQILRSHPEIDVVIRGEGEYPLLTLTERIIAKKSLNGIKGICYRDRGEIIVEGIHPLIENLDSLPMPIFDQLPLDSTKDCLFVASSRGCYGKCSFCSIQSFYRLGEGRVWRGRSAKNVISEIKQLVSLTGNKKITFIDDNFVGPGMIGRQRAEGIAAELIKENIKINFNFACRANDVEQKTFKLLKTAGLAAVTLGIESVSEEALKSYNKLLEPGKNYLALKILERLKIFTEIDFIFFNPFTTLQEIRKNLDFIETVRRSSYAYFNKYGPFTVLLPFNGSPITAILKKRGLLQGNYYGYKIKYKDKRIGRLAAALQQIPIVNLYEIRGFLNAKGEKGAAGLIKSIEYNLTLNRLPELVEGLIVLFSKNASFDSRGIQNIFKELTEERDRIKCIVNKFLSLIKDHYGFINHWNT